MALDPQAGLQGGHHTALRLGAGTTPAKADRAGRPQSTNYKIDWIYRDGTSYDVAEDDFRLF